MRMYEPIWLKLRSAKAKEVLNFPEIKVKEISLTAPKSAHKRIIKAVTKEKYGDVTFKFECSENCKKARISHEVKGNIIKFKLHLSIGLDDL